MCGHLRIVICIIRSFPFLVDRRYILVYITTPASCITRWYPAHQSSIKVHIPHCYSWPFGALYSHINLPFPPRPSAVFPSLPSICAVNVETTWTLLWGFKTENKSTPRCVLLNPIDLTSVIDLARILTRTSFHSIRVLLGSYLVSIAIRKA